MRPLYLGGGLLWNDPFNQQVHPISPRKEQHHFNVF